MSRKPDERKVILNGTTKRRKDDRYHRRQSKGPSWGEASIGLTLANVTEEDAAEYNLESAGVYVAKVNTKTAEKAGFQVRDRIVTVDGRSIKEADDVFSIVHFKSPGDIIPVTITREGKQYTIEIKLKRQR